MRALESLVEDTTPIIAICITVAVCVLGITRCSEQWDVQKTKQAEARARTLADLVKSGANPVLAKCLVDGDTTSVLCVQHQAPLPQKAGS